MKRIVFRRTIFQIGRPPGRFALTYDRPELPSPTNFLDTAWIDFPLRLSPDFSLGLGKIDGMVVEKGRVLRHNCVVPT
jgi:hypothetical protein